jgi:hypothetical protein
MQFSAQIGFAAFCGIVRRFAGFLGTFFPGSAKGTIRLITLALRDERGFPGWDWAGFDRIVSPRQGSGVTRARLTWACARDARFSPGYHMAAFQA